MTDVVVLGTYSPMRRSLAIQCRDMVKKFNHCPQEKTSNESHTCTHTFTHVCTHVPTHTLYKPFSTPPGVTLSAQVQLPEKIVVYKLTSGKESLQYTYKVGQ